MWLVGMMGSGKSTVGEAAASRIGVRSFDTDRMVIELARVSLPETLDDVGEEGFRRLSARPLPRCPTRDVSPRPGEGQ